MKVADAERKLVKEAGSIKMNYQLDTASSNYDKNAVDHRINTHSLLAVPVDTTGSTVDSTFTSVQLNVQANYAIGVFRGDNLILTPLGGFCQVRP